jgi:hypothetical protein
MVILGMVRIVILMQENKTPDFYFPTLAAWGANVQNRGSLLTTPPLPDPQHEPPIQAPGPWRGPNAQPLPNLVANGGATIAAPDDAVVSTKPPKLPQGL